MRSSGISHGAFSAPWGRDPVRVAEEDIRRYLIRRGLLRPPAPTNGRTMLCFLAIYTAVALVAFVGLFCLARLECDPLFSDRGLTAACRSHSGELTKIFAPAGGSFPGFVPSVLPQ